MTLARNFSRSLFHRLGSPACLIATTLAFLALFVVLPSFACDRHDEDTGSVVAQNPDDFDPRESETLRTYEDDPQNEIAKINNQGVRALQKGDFKTAIARFEETIKRNPSYRYGKSNLGIAYNNYALSLRARPKEALVYFERAAYVDPGNAITESNVNNVILMLGSDPNNIEDRENLGDQRMKDGNFDCAVVEYKAAMSSSGGKGQGLTKTFNRISRKLADAEARHREGPQWKYSQYWGLLNGDFDSFMALAMLALYALDLCIVVESMRRLSSQKRSWWIFGLIVCVISVSAGFLLGQVNAFRHVLGLLVLGLPPTRALYAVTRKKGGNLLYMAAVFLAAIPCTIFFFGWLGCVVLGSCCTGSIEEFSLGP